MSIEKSHTTIAERILLVRKNAGLKQSEFAKNIGISQGYLSELQKGSKSPSETLLIAISLRYAINLEWLLTGEGPMMVETTTATPELPHVDPDEEEILRLLRAVPELKPFVKELLRRGAGLLDSFTLLER